MSDDQLESITRLEEEVAHLRHVNDELSGELAEQWKHIAKLEKTITCLESRIAGFESQLGIPEGNVKPPHW